MISHGELFRLQDKMGDVTDMNSTSQNSRGIGITREFLRVLNVVRWLLVLAFFSEDCILCLICAKVCGILCDVEFRLTPAACSVAGRIFFSFPCARSYTANVLPI